uniref:CW domain-containing protein n=1 Tax=Caenorhabditis tropicalis TaxID=1561998 RepID=A0A1I7TII0_9PELO
MFVRYHNQILSGFTLGTSDQWKECNSRGSDFICMMRTWISEQNTCTLNDIDQKCGAEAAGLFQELQATVFEPSYPVVCNPGNDTVIPEQPRLSIIKEKKIKTQYRKPAQKSKTEIQEYPMVLTSPATPSTAENIYIALPEQSNVYMRPQRPTYATNLTNNIVSLYPNQGESQEKSSIWKKGGYGQKVQYNKEHWKQKTTSGEFVFTTQHPLFTTTEYGATPRRHKVIDILKSLIPPNLPSQLTALLENTYDKELFPEIQSYNTPAVAYPPIPQTYATSQAIFEPEIVTSAPKTTMIPPLPVKITYRPAKTATTSHPVVLYPSLPATTAKWKPWYLGGA